jgi:hypothetical protein
MPLAYSVLMYSCERSAMSARAEMTKTEECAKSFMTGGELDLAGKYHGYLKEEDMRDALSEIDQIDALLKGREVDPAGVAEAKNLPDDIIDSLEADLQKVILVSLARAMQSLGIKEWPRDPEGQEKIQDVIDELSRGLIKMGRRFDQLTRSQLRILKRRGPEAYQKIIRRWMVGTPEPEETTEAGSPQ